MRNVLGSKMFCSYGLYLQNIGSYDSNARDLRSFVPKITKIEQSWFGLVDFSEIRDFSKIMIFMDVGRPSIRFFKQITQKQAPKKNKHGYAISDGNS